MAVSRTNTNTSNPAERHEESCKLPSNTNLLKHKLIIKSNESSTCDQTSSYGYELPKLWFADSLALCSLIPGLGWYNTLNLFGHYRIVSRHLMKWSAPLHLHNTAEKETMKWKTYLLQKSEVSRPSSTTDIFTNILSKTRLDNQRFIHIR